MDVSCFFRLSGREEEIVVSGSGPRPQPRPGPPGEV